MNRAGVLVLFALLAVVSAQNKYTNRYDNIDIDKILSNDRVLANYIKCLMEEGPCTPDGRELKRTLPDALSTNCEKCSTKQKETAEKVMKHLMTKRAKDWERLTKKYDPQGNYKKKYESLTKSSQ